MIDLSTVNNHPCIEEIVNVLCNKTQNTDKGFYKVEVAYFLAKMASAMRASINTKDRGRVPINIYALCLGASGFGKGHSISIMENEFIRGFKKRFLSETMPKISKNHLDLMAQERALRNNTADNVEKDILLAEYKRLGAYPFTFDSGTAPAVKQLRDKLLMANCGSINLQIDEIGSNLIGATEVLNIFLELYDQGMVKQKLVKNTADNSRSEDRDGSTPTNMLLFGTPVKLLDGDKTENEFYSFLEIGYARRCLFGIGKINKKALYSLAPAEIFKRLTDPSNKTVIDKWSKHFMNLADPSKFNWQISMPDDVSIKLIEYKSECERKADALPDHEEIKKAELSHRYFKSLKLAGALAFIDESIEVTETHLYQAIKLVEESGKAFESILTREKTYMKLAKYIASADTEVTHADLTEKLPFYKNGLAARNEMMSLAIAWGYKNAILIKKSVVDGIDFFKGETLKPTNLDEIIVSHSDDFADGYEGERAPWDKLDILFKYPNHNWCNHWFNDQHRITEKAQPKFNMVVVDVDEGISIESAMELLKDYKFIIYSTKRSTVQNNRFRIIIPLEYILELDSEDYKEFMNNVLKWLPFKSDEAANQIAKKWEAFDGARVEINDGKLLDPFPFIPKTSRNEQYLKSYQKIESLDNLERGFAQRMQVGDRNNQMLKSALCLKDSGLSYDEVEKRVLWFNKQLKSPLTEAEIKSSILVTTAKAYE